MAIPKSYATAFTGLSHPRRILLLNVLIEAKDPMTFGALQTKAGLNAQAMTHHLRQMEHAGLIKRHPKGRETYISLHLGGLFHSFATVAREGQREISLAA